MKPANITQDAGTVCQREVDAFWCVLLLAASLFVTVPPPGLAREGGATLGLVLSDLAVPVLCLWAWRRGIFGKLNRRLLIGVTGLCAAIMAQTAAAAVFSTPVWPLAMMRDTIKLTEFVLYTALLMQVLRHDQMLYPSRWVVPFCFGLIATAAAGLGVFELYSPLGLFETQYANAVVCLFAVYVLLSPELNPDEIPWSAISVGLIACGSCALIPSQTFLPAAAAMTFGLIILPIVRRFQASTPLQVIALVFTVVIAFGLTVPLAFSTDNSPSDWFAPIADGLAVRLQIWGQLKYLPFASLSLLNIQAVIPNIRKLQTQKITLSHGCEVGKL